MLCYTSTVTVTSILLKLFCILIWFVCFFPFFNCYLQTINSTENVSLLNKMDIKHGKYCLRYFVSTKLWQWIAPCSYCFEINQKKKQLLRVRTREAPPIINENKKQYTVNRERERDIKIGDNNNHSNLHDKLNHIVTAKAKRPCCFFFQFLSTTHTKHDSFRKWYSSFFLSPTQTVYNMNKLVKKSNIYFTCLLIKVKSDPNAGIFPALYCPGKRVIVNVVREWNMYNHMHAPPIALIATVGGCVWTLQTQ